MNYETVKSLILTVLVGLSFLLTYILWSYQPNYDYFQDTSYVNEVDIGGVEKSRNDLIKPSEIVFRNEEQVLSFLDPLDQETFYQDISSVVLYDYNVSDIDGRPAFDEYIEIIYPDAIPAETMFTLFNFEGGEATSPSWLFNRVFLTMNEENRTLQVAILSEDQTQQVTATIEKSETYELLGDYIDGHPSLEEYLVMDLKEPIYLPKGPVKLESKTLVASRIEPDEFINALFANPNLVTPNMKEAYFTDGQRGMRILHDGRRLEFINPIQLTEEWVPNPLEVLDQSVTNINEHKGWTNNYLFDELNLIENNIKYRLYYDGYPIYNNHYLSIMKQAWRDQVLFEYERPLIQIGNLLNAEEVELISGEQILESLQGDLNYDARYVQNIKIGYNLRYIGDSYSLELDPSWFILYENEWFKYDGTLKADNISVEGED